MPGFWLFLSHCLHLRERCFAGVGINQGIDGHRCFRPCLLHRQCHSVGDDTFAQGFSVTEPLSGSRMLILAKLAWTDLELVDSRVELRMGSL